MSHGAQLYVWLVLPYAAMAIFVGGLVWRYRRDQFGWTSRSTQLLESRLLAWGSNLFHWGAIGVILGHVLGILIPVRTTKATRPTRSPRSIPAPSAIIGRWER